MWLQINIGLPVLSSFCPWIVSHGHSSGLKTCLRLFFFCCPDVWSQQITTSFHSLNFPRLSQGQAKFTTEVCTTFDSWYYYVLSCYWQGKNMQKMWDKDILGWNIWNIFKLVYKNNQYALVRQYASIQLHLDPHALAFSKNSSVYVGQGQTNLQINLHF